MQLTDDLYRALKDAKKKELEKQKEREKLEAKARTGEPDDGMSEEDFLDLIRQLMVMRNISEAERERQIREVMNRSGKDEKEFNALVEVERIRADAETKRASVHEKLPELEMAKPVSYSKKDDEPVGLYGNQPDDRYVKAEQSEFQKMQAQGESEFEKIRKEGHSEYAQIVWKDKDKAPSKSY